MNGGTPGKCLNRAVFLDRDGVLNRAKVRNGKPYAPRSLRDFRLLPNAGAAVGRLKDAGFLVIVVTNQPDIGNGLVDPAEVEAMNARLTDRVPVDGLMMCPHRQDEGCACRKPRPGMILEAARKWSIDLGASYLIGDRESDIVAGRTAGCSTILVDRRHGEGCRIAPDARAPSLAAAVNGILLSESDP